MSNLKDSITRLKERRQHYEIKGEKKTFLRMHGWMDDEHDILGSKGGDLHA